MTLLIRPGAPAPETQIKLQTRRGHDIPNAQGHEISESELNRVRERFARTHMAAIIRCNPTAQYNCHGMTFASRRTGIYDISAIDLILRDDGYQEIHIDEVKPGDVIIYYIGDEPDHSGVVVSPPDPGSRMPMVCSKWGKFSEYVHSANDCPYFNDRVIKYYRMRS